VLVQQATKSAPLRVPVTFTVAALAIATAVEEDAG
jgi:hypothetical protein